MQIALAKKAMATCSDLKDRKYDERISRDVGASFSVDVKNGLGSPEKALSPKYFYDALGSQYFDEICLLDEYYPYRTELALLPKVMDDMSRAFSDAISVVEFGAGSLVKIRPILQHISCVSEYVPIDICGDHLLQSCEALQEEFPNILMKPVEGDFSQHIQLTSFRGGRLGFFPGSTIGNFSPSQAQHFLTAAKQTLQSSPWESFMLVGVDTKKSPKVLHAAYNDEAGVTAKFNLNILHRINRELDANIDPDNFEHYAFYNAPKGRVEMHLVSKQACEYRIDDRVFQFHHGESIHTESSYKYSPDEFEQLAMASGWRVANYWMAEGDLFSLFLLKNV